MSGSFRQPRQSESGDDEPIDEPNTSWLRITSWMNISVNECQKESPTRSVCPDVAIVYGYRLPV